MELLDASKLTGYQVFTPFSPYAFALLPGRSRRSILHVFPHRDVEVSGLPSLGVSHLPGPYSSPILSRAVCHGVLLGLLSLKNQSYCHIVC